MSHSPSKEEGRRSWPVGRASASLACRGGTRDVLTHGVHGPHTACIRPVAGNNLSVVRSISFASR